MTVADCSINMIFWMQYYMILCILAVSIFDSTCIQACISHPCVMTLLHKNFVMKCMCYIYMMLNYITINFMRVLFTVQMQVGHKMQDLVSYLYR